MSIADPSPGLLVVSRASGTPGGLHLSAAQAALGSNTRVVCDCPDVTIAASGLPDAEASFTADGHGPALLLALHPREIAGRLSAEQSGKDMRGGLAASRWQPACAAVAWNTDSSGIVAAADWLGFRHLYLRRGAGWAAMSTSALALGAVGPPELDRVALGTQSLLGWQLGLRTPFADVRKLPPGHTVQLRQGMVELPHTETRRPDPELPTGSEAVSAAAAVVRDELEVILDDEPEIMLQLTGGLDSRILLGAIPVRRRRGLHALTLDVPHDIALARHLADRFGMRHHIVTFDGLAELEPDVAFSLCLSAATKNQCSTDPLAGASLGFAEAKADQGPRLSGLGGEVARGFYYFGPVQPRPVTTDRARQLARWRLFSNASVPLTSLAPDFVTESRAATTAEVEALLSAAGTDWLPATDEFYLWQRMQRWAGTLASGTCFDRPVTNPMLDARFIDLARRQPVSDKRHMRYLSRILVELDVELAGIPLDGRPPPAAYAQGGVRSGARSAALTGRKVYRKVAQRLAGRRRPPAGGSVLAAKVVDHIRREPTVLAPLRDVGIFAPEYLAGLVDGSVGPDPASIAFLVNVIALLSDATP